MSSDFDYTVFNKCCEDLILTYKKPYISKSITHVDYLLEDYTKDVYRCYLSKTNLPPSEIIQKYVVANIQKFRIKLKEDLEKIRNP
jgi:hypothetical protein